MRSFIPLIGRRHYSFALNAQFYSVYWPPPFYSIYWPPLFISIKCAGQLQRPEGQGSRRNLTETVSQMYPLVSSIWCMSPYTSWLVFTWFQRIWSPPISSPKFVSDSKILRKRLILNWKLHFFLLKFFSNYIIVFFYNIKSAFNS